MRFHLTDESGPVSYADTLALWQRDERYRELFIETLAQSPFVAFKWETPPLTRETAGQPFQFVLLDAPQLQRPASHRAFSRQLDGTRNDVVAFHNLGGDALMVVPRQLDDLANYCHLAAFCRSAPRHQQHALWQEVGRSVEQSLSKAPLWLSTAGGGVPWLHVRLDSRPKYYGHAPYRTAA